MEYIGQYNLYYHPRKANVVADALSRKTRCCIACLAVDEWEILWVLNEYGLGRVTMGNQASLFSVIAQLTLIIRVSEAQHTNEESNGYRVCILSDHGLDRWTISEDGGL